MEGESCQSDGVCECGLGCSDGLCLPYDGDNAGCSCEAGTTEPEADAADKPDTTDKPDKPGEPLLGRSGSVPDVADLTKVTSKKLYEPAGLAFNPKRPNELWIANRDNDSLTVFVNNGESNPQSYLFKSGGHHFLGEVVAIAFGDNGTFATCGDSENEQVPGSPSNFMGPTMWPADLSKFKAKQGGTDGVHLDMLHDTPLCMGIAASGGNGFYVFNGERGTIDWYDFKEPHEPGGEDHSDGDKRRYKGLKLKRLEGAPSHLAFDAKSGWLYIADTGNGRVLRLDTNTGDEGSTTKQYSNEKAVQNVTGATVEEIVPKSSGHLVHPSGIALHNDTVYVSDTTTGKIMAFSLDGEIIATLDTGLGAKALAGITVGPDKRLYLVDRLGNQILRVDPKE